MCVENFALDKLEYKSISYLAQDMTCIMPVNLLIHFINDVYTLNNNIYETENIVNKVNVEFFIKFSIEMFQMIKVKGQ